MGEVHDPCAATFGKLTGDRFNEAENTTLAVGPGAYDVPHVHDAAHAGAANFGAATANRFVEAPTPTAGPGSYEAPAMKRDACTADFGKAGSQERFFVLASLDDTPAVGAYEVDASWKAQATVKSNSSAFGKKTGKRFKKRRNTTRAAPGDYHVAPKWEVKRGGASFGKHTTSRFKTRRSTTGNATSYYNPGSTFGRK